MIVVPTLTHRKQSQQPIVARVITRDIPLASMNMCEGVDAKRCVIQKHGAPEKTDHEPWPSGNEEAETRDQDRGQKLEFVQPHQLRIRRKIRHFHQISCIVLSMKDPADMTVHETFVAG